MSEEQKQAVIDRDFQKMLDLGGNVYFLSKIFASEGLSYVQAVSTMTDMNAEQYQAMMVAGGRNIEGWRSKKERGEA
jgi:protocatechuate 4,5-dioxygenase alpha chain